MVNAPTAHHTTSHKRKRGAEMKGSEDAAADAAAEKRRAVWDQITRDLAVVLKEHDTHPSVLTATIPPPDSTSTAAGSSSSSSDGTPPIKRARLSSNPPTIAERLAAGTYTTPTALLSDIAAVCRTLDAPSATAPFHDLAHTLVTRECARRPDLFHGAHLPPAAAATAAPDRDKLALMVMAHHGPLFSSLQTAIATVAPAPSAERLSRSPSASGSSPTASTAPTSTCASPRTAPTSIVRVVAPLNEAALPPLISTVKAASNPLKRGAAAIAAAAADKVPTLAEAFPPVRISSLAPPKAGALGVVGLKWGGVMGPGGVAVVNGGASARPEPAGEWLLYRNHPPRTAKWRALARGEPVRQGMGLPAEVVAAYSSFAPVRDDAGAKVPAGVRGRVWWERVGREVFREAFEGHPGVGHMFREKEDEEEAAAAAAAKGSNADVEMGEAAADGGDDEEEQFRKAVESWEPDEDVPVDFRLLEGAEEGVVARKKKKGETKEGEGKEDEEDEEEDEEEEEVAGVNADETLKEISNLLKRLQSHQYIRLSTAPAPPAPRITTTSTTGSAPAAAAAATTDTSTDTPTAEELTLYNDIHTRLAHLIASLPPHATASADGTPTAPLAISPLHPLTTGTPIYTGTLPSTPPAPPAAALAALNAAVGMSPSSTSPAPIALMTRASATAPPRLQGAPNVQTYYTPPPPPQQQQYHGHQLPAATMPHHYPSPYAPPPPRVVSPGVSRVAQQQPMFHAHSMPPAATAGAAVGAAVARRVNVPPPMGLAAIGAGYGGGGGGGYGGQRAAGMVVAGAVGADALRMGVQHTQASMENGTVPGGRYAGRSRR